MSKYNSILKSRLSLSVILFLFALLCYLPSFQSDFVWDDIIYVKQEIQQLKSFDPDVSFFMPPKKENKSGGYFGIWRPILQFSWAIDAKIWGNSASGFHLTNNLLHAVSTVLLFLVSLLILKEFGRRDVLGISFISALLFALYPVHVETVSFISARSDLLCAAFLLLSMFFFVLSYNNYYYIVLSILFFYLALLSKETAIVFPLLVIAFAVIRDYRKKLLSKTTIVFIGLFILMIALYYLTRMRRYSVFPNFVDIHFEGPKLFSSELVNYLNYILISLTYYINNLVYPFEFNIFVGKLQYSIKNLTSAYVLALLLCSLLIVLIKRKKYLIIYSLIWILVTLIPAVGVSVIYLTASPFSERFLYIPSIGYCLIVVLLTSELVDFKQHSVIKYSLVTCVLLVLFVFNFKEQYTWKNNTALWASAVKRSPEYVAPHLNYGYALLEAGIFEEAEKEFLTALDPSIEGRDVERANAAGNLGNLYIRQQKFELAEQYFKKALGFDKKYKATYYYHIGLINYIRGNLVYRNDREMAGSYYNSALDSLKKSYGIAPRYGRLNLLLAEVYLRIGQVDKAAEFATKSLDSNSRGALDEQMRKRAEEISKSMR